MRNAARVVMALHASASAASAQHADRELVATLTGPVLEGGIVAGLVWDGGTLIVQSAAMERTGRLKAGYFTMAGKGMDVIALKEAPAAVERYCRCRAQGQWADVGDLGDSSSRTASA